MNRFPGKSAEFSLFVEISSTGGRWDSTNKENGAAALARNEPLRIQTQGGVGMFGGLGVHWEPRRGLETFESRQKIWKNFTKIYKNFSLKHLQKLGQV